MFKRLHHQHISQALNLLNSDLLWEAECYFAGGTAITLLLDEYRESVDIDFLCASKQGYRLLRNVVSADSLGALFNEPVKLLREVRADRYGIRTFIEVNGTPIKFEIVSEGRIPISGDEHANFNIPLLSKHDMFAEKLLANTDRGLDKSTASRDIIDLAMMIHHWGDIPVEAWNKAEEAYGEVVAKAFNASLQLIKDESYLRQCLKKMNMADEFVQTICLALSQ
ncbi:MAG: nucleotidyl transferase AbiEii/AbiGii toxin family protein [Moraxellaceae bacterium]|nr:MAG: nucleotidyl transferase AbiEii/AbiGii toxin family protein [Moraxellaceae bacterium]